LYRRSLPPPPGTLSRCKYCGQKFYTRKNNQDETDFGVSVVHWPEQLRRLRKPDIVEYNFSEATRLRVRIEHSKNRRPSSIRKGVLRSSTSERHFFSSSSSSSIKKLRRSSSSSSIKKIDAILDNSTTTTRKNSLRRVGSEFIRRLPSQDIERYAPQPVAPMDWKQCTMVGQNTDDGREVLVDQSSGFRFALSPVVVKKARVIWISNAMCSPIFEGKRDGSKSPLMSTMSSLGTDDSETGRRHRSSGYHTISFHFDVTQYDDSKVTTWHKAEVTTKHPTASTAFEYFQNRTYETSYPLICQFNFFTHKQPTKNNT